MLSKMVTEVPLGANVEGSKFGRQGKPSSVVCVLPTSGRFRSIDLQGLFWPRYYRVPSILSVAVKWNKMATKQNSEAFL